MGALGERGCSRRLCLSLRDGSHSESVVATDIAVDAEGEPTLARPAPKSQGDTAVISQMDEGAEIKGSETGTEFQFSPGGAATTEANLCSNGVPLPKGHEAQGSKLESMESKDMVDKTGDAGV